jgi:hypothetical protein
LILWGISYAKEAAEAARANLLGVMKEKFVEVAEHTLIVSVVENVKGSYPLAGEEPHGHGCKDAGYDTPHAADDGHFAAGVVLESVEGGDLLIVFEEAAVLLVLAFEEGFDIAFHFAEEEHYLVVAVRIS